MSEMILFHRLSMVGVVTTAYTIYARPAQVPSLMLIVVMCIIAFLIRDLLFREVDLFQDWKLEREKIERKKNFVFGDEIESLNPEKQEREFRLHFVGKPIKFVAIASFWALPISFYVANRFRVHPTDVQMSLLPALLIVSSIAQTSHFSQFVLPVLWSVLGVFVAALTKTEISVVKAFVFVLSVVANFVIYNQIRMSCLAPKAHDKTWLPRAASSSIWITIGFSVLFLVFSSLLPESLKLPEAERKEILSRKAKNKIVKVVAENVVRADEFISRRKNDAPTPQAQAQDQDPTRSSDEPLTTDSQEHPGKGSQRNIAEGRERPELPIDPSILDEGYLKGDFKPQGPASKGGDDLEPKGSGGYGPEDLEQNLKNLQALAPKGASFEELKALDEMAKDLPRTPEASSQEPIQPTELEKALKELQPQQRANQELLNQELEKFAKLSPEEKQIYIDRLPKVKQVIERERAARKQPPTQAMARAESSEKNGDRRPRTSPGKENVNGNGKDNGDGNGGNRGERGSGERREESREQNGPRASGELTAEKPSVPRAGQDRASSKRELEEKSVPKEKPRQERVKDLEEKINFIVEALMKNMKLLLFAGALAALLFYFLRASRRQKENGKWQLSDAEKKSLAEEIKKIRKASLEPDQEIVETYNVMLNAFEIVQLGREAGTPARIHVDMVSKRLPSLNEPLSFATDSFDRVLYGMTHPSKDELSRFRQSTKKVFKQFDISVA